MTITTITAARGKSNKRQQQQHPPPLLVVDKPCWRNLKCMMQRCCLRCYFCAATCLDLASGPAPPVDVGSRWNGTEQSSGMADRPHANMTAQRRVCCQGLSFVLRWGVCTARIGQTVTAEATMLSSSPALLFSCCLYYICNTCCYYYGCCAYCCLMCLLLHNFR